MKKLYQIVDLETNWRSGIYTNYKRAKEYAQWYVTEYCHKVNICIYKSAQIDSQYLSLKDIETIKLPF